MRAEATDTKPAATTQEGYCWWLFTACVLVSLTNEVSTAVMNLSLGAMRRDLGASSAVMQMAVTLGKLVLGAFMLAGGVAGDIYGRRRVLAVRAQLADAYRHAFSLGVGAVFTCTTLVCLLCAVLVWFGLKKISRKS